MSDPYVGRRVEIAPHVRVLYGVTAREVFQLGADGRRGTILRVTRRGFRVRLEPHGWTVTVTDAEIGRYLEDEPVERSYTVGAPVVVTIAVDGTVSYSVDLSEVEDAVDEDDEQLIPDDVREADRALIDADTTTRKGWATIPALNQESETPA